MTFAKDSSEGVFVFQQTVSDEDMSKLKELLPKIGGGDVTYTRADGTIYLLSLATLMCENLLQINYRI